MFGAQSNTTTSTSAPGLTGGFTFGSAATGTGSGGFSFGGGAATTGSSGSTAATTGFAGFGGTALSAGPQSAGGFNFGATATKAPTAPAGGGFGGFSLGTQPSTVTQTPQTSQAPAVAPSGFSFGAATTSTAGTPATGATGLGGGGFSLGSGTPQTGAGGFGLKPPQTAATSAPTLGGGFTGFGAVTTTTTTSGGSGGSLLGGLLSNTTTAATAATAAAPAPAAVATVTTTTSSTGFNFGGTVTASSSTGFSFGSTVTQAQTTSTPSLGTGGTGLSLGGFGTSAATSAATTSLAVSSTSSTLGTTSGAGQKQMTFRQLEDTINKWTTELEEQEKYFLDQATQVNAWDRIVMENGEKISQLNKDVEKVKLDQQKLDHELDFVHSQQRELEELLIPLEKALDSMPAISYQQHADVEREHTYTLAESLDAQLKRMGQDLKEIIERHNSTNAKPDSSDPVQQITQILNAHVVSLMWVDRNTGNLQRRVEEISKQMDMEKREQERNFRLAYS